MQLTVQHISNVVGRRETGIQGVVGVGDFAGAGEIARWCEAVVSGTMYVDVFEVNTFSGTEESVEGVLVGAVKELE